MCHCPSGRCGLKYSLSFHYATSFRSLSFGTVWIEILRQRDLLAISQSLSFGTVWIEMPRLRPFGPDVRVTVLRDGVD